MSLQTMFLSVRRFFVYLFILITMKLFSQQRDMQTTNIHPEMDYKELKLIMKRHSNCVI